MNILRSELRALGSLDTTRITTKLYEIMGFQAAMAVIGHARGRRRLLPSQCDDSLRSMSLIYAWLFSVAIFEVARVDAHAAMTKLRLSAVEAVALTCTGLLVLLGLASYMLAEQAPTTCCHGRGGRRRLDDLGLYFNRIVWVAPSAPCEGRYRFKRRIGNTLWWSRAGVAPPPSPP